MILDVDHQGTEYNFIVKPLKRPFADWVDGLIVPPIMEFVGNHPVISVILIAQIVTAPRMFWDGGASEFLTFFGMLDFCFLGWLAVDWDIARAQRRVQRLRQSQICVYCGYDLRATPERCPECGRRVDGTRDLLS